MATPMHAPWPYPENFTRNANEHRDYLAKHVRDTPPPRRAVEARSEPETLSAAIKRNVTKKRMRRA